jgi:uncharacterized RDD family membrane protein YckC
MKTVEEIKVNKTFYHRERDASGKTERIPYKKLVKRPVEIVEQGKRFGYFVIDSIIIYTLLWIIGFMLIFGSEGSMIVLQFSELLPILTWLCYYFIFEVTLQQTPGKMILGYMVINKYAEKPNAGTVALRTICRLIPFETFSCFSEKGGWHDRFSETYVVSKEERSKLLNLLGNLSDETNELLDSH